MPPLRLLGHTWHISGDGASEKVQCFVEQQTSEQRQLDCIARPYVNVKVIRISMPGGHTCHRCALLRTCCLRAAPQQTPGRPSQHTAHRFPPPLPRPASASCGGVPISRLLDAVGPPPVFTGGAARGVPPAVRACAAVCFCAVVRCRCAVLLLLCAVVLPCAVMPVLAAPQCRMLLLLPKAKTYLSPPSPLPCPSKQRSKWAESTSYLLLSSFLLTTCFQAWLMVESCKGGLTAG